jgi:hypothetical protein
MVFRLAHPASTIAGCKFHGSRMVLHASIRLKQHNYSMPVEQLLGSPVQNCGKSHGRRLVNAHALSSLVNRCQTLVYRRCNRNSFYHMPCSCQESAGVQQSVSHVPDAPSWCLMHAQRPHAQEPPWSACSHKQPGVSCCLCRAALHGRGTGSGMPLDSTPATHHAFMQHLIVEGLCSLCCIMDP